MCLSIIAVITAVAGETFMNEFAPYVMEAPPLKRRTRQRFTEFNYNPICTLFKFGWRHMCSRQILNPHFSTNILSLMIPPPLFLMLLGIRVP